MFRRLTAARAAPERYTAEEKKAYSKNLFSLN
jgi:hypothetical protein